MTNEEFDTALSRCNKQFQTGEAAKAARRVLVDGLSKAEAGRECGKSREWARVAAERVEREYFNIIDAPPGWVCKTICIPKEAMQEVSDIEYREKKKIGLIVG